MAIADPTRLTAHAAADALRSGELTSQALTQAYLDRIQVVDPAVRAYLAVTADVALAEAATADERRAAGDDGPLLGVPYALEDTLATAGITTTAGSRHLADHEPTDSSFVHRRLQAAGAVLLGKLNVGGSAPGSATSPTGFFGTRDPWNLAQPPGVDGGGVAAAIAADLAAFALGTAPGQSVYQVAARCGVVGLQPTHGRVSGHGVVASLIRRGPVGPLAKDVRDAALVLGVIAGHDPADATSLDAPVPDYAALLDDSIAGLRLGVPAAPPNGSLLPRVGAAVATGIDVLERLGARRLPLPELTAPYAPVADHHGAAAVRENGPRDLRAALAGCDVIVVPDIPATACRCGTQVAESPAMYLTDSCCCAVNDASHPGAGVPCGFVDGVPVGLLVMGQPWDEATVLRVAHAYEQATTWHRRGPDLTEVFA